MSAVQGRFVRALRIQNGDVVALVGCGGKTSLMWTLARELREGKVLVSTTTRIRRPVETTYDWLIGPGEPPRTGINVVYGTDMPEGKMQGPSPDTWTPHADAVVLLEADGSKTLPLKGWEAYEPVVPEATTLTIGVCTLWPVGEPASEALVHRPALFEALTGTAMGEMITLDTMAAMIASPDGLFGKARGRRVLYISQVETEADRAKAVRLLDVLPVGFFRGLCAVVCGSVVENRCEVLWHGMAR